MNAPPSPSRRFSLPTRLLANQFPAQPSPFDTEPTPSTSAQNSVADTQKAESLFRRLNRRSKVVFGMGSDHLDFGCQGVGDGNKSKGHGRSVSSSAYTASYAVKVRTAAQRERTLLIR